MDRPSNSTSDNYSARLDKNGPRVLVCSIPKSGTYLLGRIFEELGLEDTCLHISRSESSLYQNGNLQAYRSSPERFRVDQPFRECVSQICPRQFAVSHLPCDSETKKLATELRVVFLHRDLRDCLISLMRFIADSGRDACFGSAWIQMPDGPERLAAFMKTYDWFCAQWVEPLLGWQKQAGVLSVSFEDLMGDNGQVQQRLCVQALCSHVGIDPMAIDLDRILLSALNVSTLTWSGNRSRRDQYWSSAAEATFKKMKGIELNRKLGYDFRNEGLAPIPKLIKQLRFVH